MANVLRIAGQVLAYVVFMAVVGYFSASPSYTHLAEDKALVKISFSRAGETVTECRRLTPKEIAALAPNMRRQTDCPRERVPLLLHAELDGKPLIEETLEPTGLWSDGPSNFYRRIPVMAGQHELKFSLRDSRRTEGFDYEAERTLELSPGQNLVVDFKPAQGGFVFR